MITPAVKNLSFRAIFKFNGKTKEEKDGFIDFIKDEVAMSYDPKTQVSAHEYKNSTIILTGNDSKAVKNSKRLPNHLIKHNLEISNADKFYDKKSKRLLHNVIYFDPIFGECEKICLRHEKKFTTSFTKVYNGIQEFYKGESPKIKLKKPVNILKAINLLEEPLEKIKNSNGFGLQDFNVYKQAIKQNSKLKNLDIKGVAGMGFYSIVFNIDDEKVLKLSREPCFPKKIEPFDLPIIDNNKGYISTSENTIYYCINPKGKNHNEARITSKDVKYVMNQIEEKGYKLNDLDSLKFKQIVMVDGKPYLCDYDCARDENGKSRLFVAPSK